MKKKRILPLVLCVLFVISSLLTGVSAQECEDDEGPVVYLDVNDITNSPYFEEVSREEYITEKANNLGVTYEEAEAIVDANIQNTLASIPSPATWDPDYYESNGDSTSTVYGRLSCIYTHTSGFKVIYYTQAVVIAHHYGQTWSDCDATGGADPYGDGEFTFSGTTTAKIVNSTTIRMTCSGYFQVEYDVALSLGITECFSASVSGSRYLRDNISTYMTEVLRQSAS